MTFQLNVHMIIVLIMLIAFIIVTIYVYDRLPPEYKVIDIISGNLEKLERILLPV